MKKELDKENGSLGIHSLVYVSIFLVLYWVIFMRPSSRFKAYEYMRNRIVFFGLKPGTKYLKRIPP